MKWFKKINEKRQQKSDELGHKVFGDIWDNKREKSALFLLLWFMFMLLVIGMVRTNNQIKSNENANKNKEIEYQALSNYFENKDNDNYEYNISIYDLNNASFTYYNGDVINDVETGTKESNADVINYKINNGIAYNTNNNQVINNLYGNYLTLFFKLNNIYDFIKDCEPEVKYEDDIKVYDYKELYENKNIEFIIKTDEKSITYIEYNYDNYKYIINITSLINRN